jgi:hypothetical protein
LLVHGAGDERVQRVVVANVGRHEQGRSAGVAEPLDGFAARLSIDA